MATPPKIRFGLVFPLGFEYARQMIQGISEFRDVESRVELHLLSKDGSIPRPDEVKVDLHGILAFRPSSDLAKLRALAPHVVCTSNQVKPEGADFVISDDVETGRLGAEYLIHHGYRELVFVGRPASHYSEERYQGYLAKAQEEGMEVHWEELRHERDAWHLPEFLEKMPPRCAVMAANDYLGCTIINAFDDPETRIPLQVAVLGVDNDPLQISLGAIPLSSIELGGVAVGFEAAKRLIRRIESPGEPFDIKRISPIRVQTRRSTDFFALEDDLAAKALRIMHEDLRHLHDVSDLVERVGQPRRTLELRFRNATGGTLARELARLRVEKARELLHHQKMDTESVAREVGLPESRMLWLLFKRLTGETPTAYRKRVVPGS